MDASLLSRKNRSLCHGVEIVPYAKAHDLGPTCVNAPHPLDGQDRTHLYQDIDVVGDLLWSDDRDSQAVEVQGCRRFIRVPTIDKPDFANNRAFPQQNAQQCDILVYPVVPDVCAFRRKKGNTDIDFFHSK